MSGRLAPVVAVLLILVTCPAYAQTPIADAAAGWCGAAAVGCDTAPAMAASVSSPADHKAAAASRSDGHLPLVLGAFLTAASADVAVSMYQIGRGTAREAGFGSAWQDRPVPFAVSKGAMAALFMFGVQRIHKDRPKAALILGISATVVESMLVVRAARTMTRYH